MDLFNYVYFQYIGFWFALGIMLAIAFISVLYKLLNPIMDRLFKDSLDQYLFPKYPEHIKSVKLTHLKVQDCLVITVKFTDTVGTDKVFSLTRQIGDSELGLVAYELQLQAIDNITLDQLNHDAP